MEDEFQLNLRESNLTRLNYILNYELSSGLMLLLSYLYILLIFLSAIAAIIFTPFLLYVLVKEKKTGWLIFFFISIFFPPFIFSLLLPVGIFSLVNLSIMLGGFYLYCFLLKMQTRDWVKEENAAKELEEKRRLKKIKDDLYFLAFKEKQP